MVKAKITKDGLLLQPAQSLSLGLDNDGANTTSDTYVCCTPFSTRTSKFSALPLSNRNLIQFKNILWVDSTNQLTPKDIEITYLKSANLNDKDSDLIPVTQNIQLEFENPLDEQQSLEVDLASLLMSKSYQFSKPSKSVLVLINPRSGKGKSLSLYHSKVEPILNAARYEITLQKTRYHEHATEIARSLDINQYDMIICASGDGTPHEVINGLYQRSDRVEAFNKLLIVQTPCGSGNAMSLSCLGTLNPSRAALEIVKGNVVKTDLMAVCQNNRDVKLSFLSQTYGIIAEADIGTEWMRFLGAVRFDIGVCLKVFSKAKYPCEIGVKFITRNKEELNNFYKEQVKLGKSGSDNDSVLLVEDDFKLQYFEDGQQITLSRDRDDDDWEWLDQGACDNLGIFYAGKMPYISKDTNFFPAALPNDGSIDIVVLDASTNVLKTADALLSLDKGLHVWKDEIGHYKVEAFKLIPMLSSGKKSHISVDGEDFPVEPMQVELLNGIMKTVMCDGNYKETGFLDKL